MKISLRFKFIISYIILKTIMLVLLNTYARSMIYKTILSSEETYMYNEASVISREYLSNTYLVKSSLPGLRRQFDSIQTLTNIRIMMVTTSGEINVDSDLEHSLEGENIYDHDSSFLTYQSVTDTTINGLLDKKSIAVIYPMTSSLETKAYIVLSHPVDTIHRNAINYIDKIIICYIILALVMLVAFIYLYIQTAIPFKILTKAAKNYADGHFDYKPEKLYGHDQTDLEAAIGYMANKMSDMNDYQKKFIANVSHDFRSPLTSIKGYTEAMLDGTIPPEMQEKYLGIILFETERLTKLTGNLLALSQFESNGLPMEISTFDINYELKRCSMTFEQRCTEKKVSLELLFDEKELFVDADLGKIEQVIQNLLDNAIKFSHNDSTIQIHTTKRNQKIFVSIKDRGIGIPKDSLNKVWDRFYKTDLSRGKDKKGTGLGLSITKEIIEAHGENINVISTEGVGTEFIFSLPEHQKE